MARVKCYIDSNYDQDKSGPSNGSIFRPYKTIGEAEDSINEDSVDDYIFMDLDDSKEVTHPFNFEGIAAWLFILIVGGSVGYFIIVTLVDLIRKIFGT